MNSYIEILQSNLHITNPHTTLTADSENPRCFNHKLIKINNHRFFDINICIFYTYFCYFYVIISKIKQNFKKCIRFNSKFRLKNFPILFHAFSIKRISIQRMVLFASQTVRCIEVCLYSKKLDFKKSHFFYNQDQKNFLINFGIYVGYKKKLNPIFYHIKFSRNKNFCSITRKIDFLNIF